MPGPERRNFRERGVAIGLTLIVLGGAGYVGGAALAALAGPVGFFLIALSVLAALLGLLLLVVKIVRDTRTDPEERRYRDVEH